MGGGIQSGRSSSSTYSERKYSKSLESYKDKNETKPKKRVFLSFNMQDELMIKLLRHQAKSDRFELEFTDYSIKEPFEEKWKTQCLERIRHSSVVIIMIGENTHSREAVSWEIKKAYELNKTVIGVRMHRNENHKIPQEMIEKKANIVNWNMDDIQEAIDNAE